MPIYEYRCQPCNQTFELLVRTASEQPRCPECGAERLEKQFSVPASAQAGAGARGGPLPMAAGPGCGAPACCGGGCQIG